MGIDWKKQDETEKAGLEALHALGLTVAAALTAESGEEWAGVIEDCPAAWNRMAGPENMRWANFRRARDGFTLQICPSGAYNKKGQGKAGIVWPKNPNDKSAVCVKMSAARGFAYDTAEPDFSFTSAKTQPANLARRLLKELTGEEFDKARAHILDRWRADTARLEAAHNWREAVQDASGITYRESHDRTGFFWVKREAWGEIESDNFDAGGKVTLKIPACPVEAAKLVQQLRAIIETNNAGSV